MKVDPGTLTGLTFVPAFPIYPPETAWMRQPTTDIPGLLLKGRIAFLPADSDRRYARESLPDYGNLLGNLVRWGAQGEFPLRLEGPGLFDCNFYRQDDRLIVHLVNLTVTRQMPIDELVAVGPMTLSVQLPAGNAGHHVKLLVAAKSMKATIEKGWMHIHLGSVLDHEVLVIE